MPASTENCIEGPRSARGDEDAAQHPRRRVMYGRRRGRRRRAGREALLRNVLPVLSLKLPPSGGMPLDPRALFEPPPAAVWLEIGFGGGEHLAAQAAAHPDVGFIGCEAYLDGVAGLLRLLTERGLGNVRILADDARLLLDSLASESVERVFLLFPDPWPKARHHKRRFISPENVDALARILVDGGRLNVATDHGGYCRWILGHLGDHPGFVWTARGPDDWRAPPPEWSGTRYEAKAHRQGRPSIYLNFARLARSAAGGGAGK